MAPMFVLVLASTMATTQAAAHLDGRWQVVWPCSSENAASDPYAQRCAEGIRDHFELDLWSQGDRLCGTHAATAHIGNRVDEDEDWGPSIAGRIKGDTAVVRFHSHWGAWGHAEIRVRGDKLTWKVLDQDNGGSWMPDKAELTRMPNSDPDTDFKPPTTCSGEVVDD